MATIIWRLARAWVWARTFYAFHVFIIIASYVVLTDLADFLEFLQDVATRRFTWRDKIP